MPWSDLEDRREPTEPQLRYYRSLYEQVNGEAVSEETIAAFTRLTMSQAINDMIRELDRRRVEGTRRTASSTVSAQDTVRTARRALEEESVFTRVTGRPSPERIVSRGRSNGRSSLLDSSATVANERSRRVEQEAPIWGHHKNNPLIPQAPSGAPVEVSEPPPEEEYPTLTERLEFVRMIDEERMTPTNIQDLWGSLSEMPSIPPLTHSLDISHTVRPVENRITVENELYSEITANVARKIAERINGHTPCQIVIEIRQRNEFATDEVIFQARIRHADTSFGDIQVSQRVDARTFIDTRSIGVLENYIAYKMAGLIINTYNGGEYNENTTDPSE